MTIRLGLKKTEDGTGIRVEITQFSPPEKTKANLLSGVYHTLVANEAVSLEDFAAFRASVEATDLDSEGMVPTLNTCPNCGGHGSIKTYAGETHQVLSFEGLKATLVDLTKCSLITADEAMVLETQAREQMPNMPENETDAPSLGNFMNMLVVEIFGRRPNRDEPENESTDEQTTATPQE